MRVNKGSGGDVGFLSFCAPAGKQEAAIKITAKAITQTKMPLLNVSTENDFAGERKSCLATKEIDVALIGRHRDGGAAIANVADNAPTFAE